jgi:hypothetical protein
MIRILIGHFLIYLYLFIIITNDIDDVIPVFLNSLIIITSYIYLGFSVKESNTKIWNYFILTFIGLTFFLICLIISPDYLLTKTISSSYIWLLLDFFLIPLEFIRPSFKIGSYLNWLSILIYLVEIMLLGFLPYLGRMLKIKITKKTATNTP